MINIQCLCVSSCCPRMTCGCRIESFLRWIFNECICPVLILFSDFLWDFRIPRFEKVLKAIECISVLLWETLSKQLYWFSLKSFKEKGLSSFCWLAFRYRPWNLFCTGLDFFVQNKTKQNKCMSAFSWRTQGNASWPLTSGKQWCDSSCLGTLWMMPNSDVPRPNFWNYLSLGTSSCLSEIGK